MKKEAILNQKAQIGMRAVAWGIVANLVLALVKYAAGFFGHSYALMADAIESGSDVLTSCVVLVGLRTASKAPDPDHPYGHGKAEPLTGIFVATVLMLGGVMVIVQSIHEIQTPHHSPEPYTLIVLVGVIAIKQFMFSRVIKAGESINSSAVKADAWHHMSDAISSGAAFIGICIALLGGKGFEVADDYAAILAGLFIMYNAWSNLLPAIKEVMDAKPDEKLLAEIDAIVNSVHLVESTHNLRVRKMGLDYFVDIHVRVNGLLSVKVGHDIAHDVKDAVRNQLPNITDVLVHIEPA